LQRRKIRTRRPELGAALTAALCLAGCGSGADRRSAPQPKLPPLVATQLADRSDRVAAALDVGDPCRALDEARKLQDDAIKAINEGRIPGPFQEHLASTVGDLVGRIQCTPPAKEHHGKGKGKGKHKHEEND
jgi:hypothetical protein